MLYRFERGASYQPVLKGCGGEARLALVREAVDHEADHGELEHGARDLWQIFIVARQPAPAPEPAEGALDSPPDNVAKFGRGPGALGAAARGKRPQRARHRSRSGGPGFG